MEDPTLKEKADVEQQEPRGETPPSGDENVIDIKEHETVAEPKEFFATVKGEQYKFRELSLSEKMHVLALLPDSFAKFLRNFKIEQKKDGRVGLSVVSDSLTLGDIPISSLITSSSEALLYILSKSFPDYGEDWSALPESETRNAVFYALILNGWGAFIQNFFTITKVAATPFMKRPFSQG
jgi:hypothetical protein